MKGFKTGAQTGQGVESHGKAMGFAKGGQVKNTSGEFVMKTEKMNSMDHGVQPAKKGVTAQEQEAGGTGRLRPGYKEGGAVKGYTQKMMKGGKACYMKGGKAYMMKGGKMCPMDQKMLGGLAGKVASKAHKTLTMPPKSQGHGVKATGRGNKMVGKGGKTGMHKSGRITKKD